MSPKYEIIKINRERIKNEVNLIMFCNYLRLNLRLNITQARKSFILTIIEISQNQKQSNQEVNKENDSSYKAKIKSQMNTYFKIFQRKVNAEFQ
ncbi:unnamed protein product [Paramecium octaurelia]|uniref:Uncharacterized protein n=1 Tax=Paramecium octaurelia TaxID=43137 RepID=A0A8S1TQL7_PAROT|nr:unnamed protein product [Paramecium octaurelia]